MTPQEAKTIVKLLCAGYRKELSQEEAEAYARRILELDYDRARQGVDYVLDNDDKFPSIARFKAVCRDVHNLSPNTGRRGGIKAGLSRRDWEGLMRQEQLVRMSDEEYEAYLDELRRQRSRVPAVV